MNNSENGGTMRKQTIGLVLLLLFVNSLGGYAYGAQLKKTVAVSRFDNSTDVAGQAAVGTAMADQLADALIQSGKFVVIERQTLEDVIAEQDIAASGRAAVSSTAQTGKIIPAQILIKGTVSEFEAETTKGGTGITISGISLGSSKSQAHVAVILRIIDSTSGQVLDSVRVEGEASAKGVKLGVDKGGVNFGTESFKKTPLGKATQIAIDKAVVEISEKLAKVPFEGRIVKVENGTIYTNIGSRNDAVPGSIFKVVVENEALTDPVTGESLGAERTTVGAIKVQSVEEKFSKAAAQSGQGFDRGMILTEGQ